MRVHSLLLLTSLFVSACGPSSSVDERLGVVQGIDTSEQGITTFVRNGQYTSWLAEPSVHDTRAPHGSKVRVFFNDVVARSLREGNTTHPVGSILVKELFEDDGKTLRGHALDIKIAEGPGKDTWLFYEGFGPDYTRNYYGRAHSTCHGCHSDGTDYVTTPLP